MQPPDAIGKAVVTYDYVGRNQHELTIRAGDTLWILDKCENKPEYAGWWIGELCSPSSSSNVSLGSGAAANSAKLASPTGWYQRKSGLFPKAYVEEVKLFKIDHSKVTPFIHRMQLAAGLLKEEDKINKDKEKTKKPKKEKTKTQIQGGSTSNNIKDEQTQDHKVHNYNHHNDNNNNSNIHNPVPSNGSENNKTVGEKTSPETNPHNYVREPSSRTLQFSLNYKKPTTTTTTTIQNNNNNENNSRVASSAPQSIPSLEETYTTFPPLTPSKTNYLGGTTEQPSSSPSSSVDDADESETLLGASESIITYDSFLNQNPPPSSPLLSPDYQSAQSPSSGPSSSSSSSSYARSNPPPSSGSSSVQHGASSSSKKRDSQTVSSSPVPSSPVPSSPSSTTSSLPSTNGRGSTRGPTGYYSLLEEDIDNDHYDDHSEKKKCACCGVSCVIL